jgi:hypothetical protein
MLSGAPGAAAPAATSTEAPSAAGTLHAAALRKLDE